MKIIFLDIDGVLNTYESYHSKDSHVPIDEHRVFLLSQICEQTAAKIVLISSWKIFWIKENDKLIANDFLAIELEKMFNHYDLKIYDKVSHGDRKSREELIIEWLSNHEEISSFIIIDDESSFYSEKMLDKLIKTSCLKNGQMLKNMFSCTGLSPEHVDAAVKKLK